MFIGGAAAAFVTVWAVTIFLPKTEGIDVLAAGLLAATLVVLPTFLIGLLIYPHEDQKIKSVYFASPMIAENTLIRNCLCLFVGWRRS